MAGWHHRLNGHEFERAPGNNEGQENPAYFSSWGCKESDMTQQLNDKSNSMKTYTQYTDKNLIGKVSQLKWL